MRTGRILRFDDLRGYGFIVPDGGGEDVFVHANELLDEKSTFTPGTVVEFEVTEGERGLKAFAVRAVETRPSSNGGTPEPQERVRVADPLDDEVMCDVLSRAQFSREITETLVTKVPELAGGQIVRIREHLLEVAHKHGWTED